LKYQRELTAAVLIPAVLAVLIAAPTWAWALLVAAASSVALLEFYAILEAAGWVVPKNAGLLLFLGLLAAAHLASVTALVALCAAALLALPTLVLFSSPPEAILLPSSAGSVFATLYVAGGGAAMIGLRALGWKPVIFLLAIVWASDSAAYYVGRKWGKRKLAPVVSPKKTWAGLFGQLGAGLAFGLTAGLVIAPERGPFGALVGAGMGLLVSGAAVVGDLVESAFKRSAAVKDSGGLLPGHGGLLDRLDSLLYASPVVLLVLTLAPEALPK
jgi:phosphatidate cytidylyltransferase